MRTFIAGGTGAIGKVLVPLLIESGHEVTALIRSAEKALALEAMGATVAVADPLNAKELAAAIVKSEPELIIHQLTALVGVGDLKKFDEEFAQTNRFRTEATATMLAAAEMVGTRRPASAKVWRRSGISKIQSGRPGACKRSRFAMEISTDRVRGSRMTASWSILSGSARSLLSGTEPVSGRSSTSRMLLARP